MCGKHAVAATSIEEQALARSVGRVTRKNQREQSRTGITQEHLALGRVRGGRPIASAKPKREVPPRHLVGYRVHDCRRSTVDGPSRGESKSPDVFVHLNKR